MIKQVKKRNSNVIRNRYRLNEHNRSNVIHNRIGNNVKFLRKRLKLNRHDLVSEFKRLNVDMSLGKLKKIEGGDKQNVDDLVALANYFDIDFYEMLQEHLSKIYR